MARPLRIDIEDGWHHVMNRGADRRAVFLHDSDRFEFGARLGDIHDRFGVETHAYCLMTTHFHLLLHCPDGGLSDAMQRLGSIYTRHVNDRVGRDGALFRGRFHSRLVETDAHLLAAVRYIHRNALDLPGVDHVERYRWSSHRAYLGYRTVPPWLRTDVVLSQFGNDITAFAAFVDDSGRPDRTRLRRSHSCSTGRPRGERRRRNGWRQPSGSRVATPCDPPYRGFDPASHPIRSSRQRSSGRSAS